MENSEHIAENTPEDKSFFGLIIHSFFVIPFFIAISAVVLFTSIQWLTKEQLTAYDYLEQVKIGGLTKRWQAAFELSKILSNGKLIPTEKRFSDEMISVFTNAKNDDERVRQYLALAMAKTGNPEFLPTLIQGMQNTSDDTLRTLVYAIGMLKDKRGIPVLLQCLDHQNPRIRSMAVVALGNIGDANIIPALRKKLNDHEPNVQWGAALSLAHFQDASGKTILQNLLKRDYLAQFKNIDQQEQTQIILQTILASRLLNDSDLNHEIKQLSKLDKSMNVRSKAMELLKNE